MRYKRAQDILFGQDMDLATRFAVKSESEKGSILLNKIFSVYQEGGKQVIPWFRADGERNIVRHPLNDRKTGATTRQYANRILQSGIVDGVRGEPWLVFDAAKNVYQALTFGTLLLGLIICLNISFEAMKGHESNNRRQMQVGGILHCRRRETQQPERQSVARPGAQRCTGLQRQDARVRLHVAWWDNLQTTNTTPNILQPNGNRQ